MDTFLEKDGAKYTEQKIKELIKTGDARIVEFSLGDVILMDGSQIHRSNPKSLTERRVVLRISQAL